MIYYKKHISQARSQGGCDAPPESGKRSTFGHKVGQKWDLCRKVDGGEAQKVHFLGSKGPLFFGGGGVLPPLDSILTTSEPKPLGKTLCATELAA